MNTKDIMPVALNRVNGFEYCHMSIWTLSLTKDLVGPELKISSAASHTSSSVMKSLLPLQDNLSHCRRGPALVCKSLASVLLNCWRSLKIVALICVDQTKAERDTAFAFHIIVCRQLDC